MAKPSELTPNTADVIKEGVEKYFDESEFSVTLGGPEVGAEFSALPFDHLLYTGSGRVGKKILAAAANNLVPTTLELGGKSPTIISDGMDLNLIAKRIMFVKTLNAGQICLSPDYIFIKRGLENDLINALKVTFNDFFTEKNQDDYTSMVNETHFKRMDQYIQDAKEKGAVVTDLAPIDNPDNNIMSTKVLLNVNDEMLVMQEEIFGPLLPVMVYDDLSEVVNYVNDHDHPLGLYFFGDDKKEQEFIINNTRSGGVTINDVMFHLMQSELPFGGVGPSGSGAYHGKEGFKNFSHNRAVVKAQKLLNLWSMVGAPYTEKTDKAAKRF